MFRGFNKMNLTQIIDWVRHLYLIIESDEFIKGELEKRGYNDEKLAEGKKIIDEVKEFIKEQIDMKNDKSEAYAKFKSAFETVEKDFYKLYRMAKVVFKNLTEKYNLLKLNEAKERSIHKQIEQIEIFLLTALNDETILSYLTKIGYSKPEVTKLDTALKNVKDLYSIYFKESKESKYSTELKEKQADLLIDYISDLVAFIRIIFEDNPEVLAKLGL